MFLLIVCTQCNVSVNVEATAWVKNELLLGKTLFLQCFLRVWEVANDSWAAEGNYKQGLGVNTWYWLPRLVWLVKNEDVML